MKDFNQDLISKISDLLSGKQIEYNSLLLEINSKHPSTAKNPLEIAHDKSRVEAEIDVYQGVITIIKKENNPMFFLNVEELCNSSLDKLSPIRKSFFTNSENDFADVEEMSRRGTINGQFSAYNDIRICSYDVSMDHAVYLEIQKRENKNK